MKRFVAKHWAIFLIICVAAFVRLWQLGNVPPSPDWDEAALGYNAYSVLKTGKDEYGTRYPLTLRSFDDYKPPLYMYLAIPSVAMFGLSTWSVRFPAAFVGVLAVIGVYALILELVAALGLAMEKKGKIRSHRPIALFGALLLAISPWHIQFSRIAFEANIGVAINIWAIALFLRFVRSGRYLWVSGILFGLGIYAYHSERIFLPLFVLLLCIIFWRTLWAHRLNAALFVIVGIATVLPLIPVLLNPTTLTRLRGTSSLADQTGLLRRSVAKLEVDRARGDAVGAVLDNRRFVWGMTVVSGYLSHFSPKWLFLSGDNARHHAPDMGMLYLWELPFLLLGMYVVARRGGKLAVFLWGWLFLAPVAAAPTTELPHGIRTLVFLPVFQIFTAFGLERAIVALNKRSGWLPIFSFGIAVLFIVGNIVYYSHMYFNHTNNEYSKYWQYGYKEAVEYAQSVRGKYKNIVVSTSLEQPHMFFLFFLAYDPVKYLSEGGTASGGFKEVRNKFDIYEFRPINWEKEVTDGTVLYIGTPLEIPNPIKTIDYLDGTEAMRIADQ